MSHFCVLVISGTNDEVEKLLQPYHEYECTGIDDEYVVHADETEGFRDIYDSIMKRRTDAGKDTKSFESFESFIQDEGADILTKEEAEAAAEQHLPDFYAVKDGDEITAVYRKTNPNRKWDWWEVGGRWSGVLKLREGAEGAVGRPGVMGSCHSEGPDRVDQARKGDIDVVGMRQQAADSAAETFDHLSPAFDGKEMPSWKHYRDVLYAGDIDAARQAYRDHPTIQDITALDRKLGGVLPFFDPPDEYLCGGDREKFLQHARDNAFCTFAVVTQDGQWFERGSMGWWGCVSGETEDSEWEREFRLLVDNQPEDKLFTIVDCHI